MNAKRPRTTHVTRPVVLLITSERSLKKSIDFVLEQAKCLPLHAATVSEALKVVGKTPLNAVLLSAVLPEMRGAELVKLLRQLPSLRRAAILALSTAGSATHEIECLKNGADDFIVEGVNDLSAIPLRLSRVWRMNGIAEAPIEKGPVRVDVESREVFVHDYPTQPLSPREFDLLVYLVRRSPRLATWTDLQRDVWSAPEHALDQGRETRTIAVHCERLRRKLGAAAGYIVVRRGMGLQFMCKP